MSYHNIYYSPEKFGLTAFADIDKSDGCYQFDLFVVWTDGDGNYYWASDSGCSCPSPFESHGRDTIARGSLRQAYEDALAWLGDKPQYDWDTSDWQRAKGRVEELLGGAS